MNDYLMIGEVLKPQGVHGEVKVKPYAANPEDFTRWKTLYRQLNGEWLPLNSRCSRVHDGFAYLTLGDCADMNAAEAFRGCQLYVDRAHANPLSEDACYISDLIGCEAVDEQGEVLGTLTDVLQHGAVDVYVFRTSRGELMVPALKRVFPQMDLNARRISVVRAALDEVAVWEE